jgi:hypothetical protein
VRILAQGTVTVGASGRIDCSGGNGGDSCSGTDAVTALASIA